MAIPAHATNSISIFSAINESVDLESSHQVMNTLVEVLQQAFKVETNYARPLMPAQANIIFVLDKETAQAMIAHMTTKLVAMKCFEEGEFRFTHKIGIPSEALQRIRLEFPEGLNATVIHKILRAIEILEKGLGLGN